MLAGKDRIPGKNGATSTARKSCSGQPADKKGEDTEFLWRGEGRE
jgi:hypothetical protein